MLLDIKYESNKRVVINIDRIISFTIGYNKNILFKLDNGNYKIADQCSNMRIRQDKITLQDTDIKFNQNKGYSDEQIYKMIIDAIKLARISLHAELDLS